MGDRNDKDFEKYTIENKFLADLKKELGDYKFTDIEEIMEHVKTALELTASAVDMKFVRNDGIFTTTISISDKTFKTDYTVTQDTRLNNVLGSETTTPKEPVVIPYINKPIVKEIESEKRISKNCFKGDQITGVGRILELSNLKRPVYHIHWGVKPASVIINMSYKIVVTAIWQNKFFEVINIKDDII